MRFLTVPTRRFSAVLLLAGLSFAIPIEGRASVLWQAASAEDFESLARAAASAREAGRSDEAVALYRRALALQSAWTEGWWYLGTLLYDTDRFREAIPAFEKLVQLAPETPGASNFLGLCAFEVGDYDRALALLEKGRGAAQDDPQLARVSSYHLALLLNRAGRFDTTLEVLSRDLAQGTVSDQITFAFGLAVLHVPLLPGEVDASREAFVHAAGRVGVLSAQGRTLEALDLYPSLLAQNPRVPFLHAAFAAALKTAGRTSDAAAQSAEESALFPQAPGPRAVAELYANEASRSRFDISSPPSISPRNPPGESFDSVSVRAQEALRANRTEQAMTLLRQALALRPDWQPGRFQLAALLFSSARYAEALPILKTAVGQNPESGTAWAMLGLCEFETRDFENALLHLQKGAALGFGGSADSIRLARYRLGLL
ncbi:MAG TPA: tetratricopeptide repeat protein, partial [Candidatus Acidoferrum sp.]